MKPNLAALRLGHAALRELGVEETEADEIIELIRRRDAERFELQVAGGSARAGMGLLFKNEPEHKLEPEPLSPPQRDAQALSPLPEGEP